MRKERSKRTLIHPTLILFGIVGSFLLLIPLVHAQSSSVTISSNPVKPGPHERVIVSLDSSTLDLDRSKISWYLDGELKLEGTGQTSVGVRTGDVGQEMRVSATIVTQGGQTITRSLVFRPLEVDLLWEAVTYTPPFYKGKSLNSSGALVSFTAMPHLIDGNGKTIPPEDIVYTWKQKGVVLGKASGYGKQSIVLESPTSDYDALQLTVVATSLNGRYSAETSVRVKISDPELLVYEEDPLEGVYYQNSFSGIEPADKDTVIARVEPYYFSTDDVALGNLKYSWKIEGQNIDVPEDEQGATLELRSEGLTGLYNVAVNVINNNLPFRVYQEANTEFQLEFK